MIEVVQAFDRTPVAELESNADDLGRGGHPARCGGAGQEQYLFFTLNSGDSHD